MNIVNYGIYVEIEKNQNGVPIINSFKSYEDIMKITIRRQYDIGTCCGDERLIWRTEEVTPQELRRLIDRGENIRVINNPYKE